MNLAKLQPAGCPEGVAAHQGLTLSHRQSSVLPTKEWMGEGVLMVIMDTCLQGDEEKYSQQGLVLWLKKRRERCS